MAGSSVVGEGLLTETEFFRLRFSILRRGYKVVTLEFAGFNASATLLPTSSTDRVFPLFRWFFRLTYFVTGFTVYLGLGPNPFLG